MPTKISLDVSNRKMQMNEQNEVFEYNERRESKEREIEKKKKKKKKKKNRRWLIAECSNFVSFFCLLYLQAIFYRKMFGMAPYTQPPPHTVSLLTDFYISKTSTPFLFHLYALPLSPYPFPLINILIDVQTAHTTPYGMLIL